MTIVEIEKVCKKMAKEYWGLDFNVKIEINKRLKKSLGRFLHNPITRSSLKFDFSHDLITHYKKETIMSVVKHELTHWALFTMKKPFDDGHPFFENELKRVGASSTKSIHFAGTLHEIGCPCCGKSLGKVTAQKKNKIIKNPDRFTSTCCRKPVIYVGEVYISDKFKL